MADELSKRTSAADAELIAAARERMHKRELNDDGWQGDDNDVIKKLIEALTAANARADQAAEIAAAWSEADLKKVYLMRAGPDYAKGGFEVVLRGSGGILIAETLAEMLRSQDAPNFIAFEVNHDELGKLEFSVQRVYGMSTVQKLASMRTALENAAGTFRRYASLHRAKGTPDGHTKADANDREAALCEEAAKVGG